MGVFNKLLRVGEGRKLKAVQRVVPLVNELEPEMEARTDAELRALTDDYRGRFAALGDDPDDAEVDDLLDELLPESFALVREAARRVLGQRHYDVQLMGGAALHFGWVAEMKTGEGKTLVSTLPVYLNALAGRGVHVVTVNDYLATRDAQWMGRIYDFLGLSVGVVVPGGDGPDEKRAAYNADITYGTNNEFGFDYLRDNMAPSRANQVQRGHRFAIVDEVDSILVDEARTPLIISGRAEKNYEIYVQFAKIVRTLKKDRDFELDEAKRTVVPTEEGIGRVEEALGTENLYDHFNQNYVHQLQAALKARELFKRDKDYIVADGEVKIVDEFTGRILEGRRWSEGIHQAVEAKEGVRIKDENQTLATVTLQNYFRLYEKLSGMTGTASTEAGEFAHTYELEVVSIPTHRPLARIDEPDLIYQTEAAKWEALADDIAERYHAGQPVLVGTISVEKSEHLGTLLDKRGIDAEVLNAKQHFREAVIVAQAGQPHAVTVATNMAGRGVDILLGGNPEMLAEEELKREDTTREESPKRYEELVATATEQCRADGDEVRELGGLYVIGTERHESRRIDNQLRGRSGRQGDPGESRFYLSLEDDLLRLFATGAMEWVMGKGFPEDVPLESRMVSKAIERAQHTVEDRNFETRKNVLEYDEVMNEQRKVIYRRRQQILDGGDLRDASMAAIESAIERAVTTFCSEELPEDWDLEELHTQIRTAFPTTIELDALGQMESAVEVEEALLDDAVTLYEEKEELVGAEKLREIERRVMLSVIDQHWRDHLYEMDYLKGGINLRAMGQRDPLSEWQREGFDMFEAMLAGIEDDFVRYVFHLKVVTPEQQQAPESGLTYTAPQGAVQGSKALRAAAGPASSSTSSSTSSATTGTALADAPRANPTDNTPNMPVTVDKTPGRNEPCHCGSGRKYKHCHGR